MTTQNFRAENEWLSNENLVLLDMFDTLQADFEDLELDLESALGDAHVSKERYQTLKDDFAYKLQKKNEAVAHKAVFLSNLVDEYQRILDNYIEMTGTKLITSELQRLRKEGGYTEL
jgi:hypothetical protein